MRRYFLCYIPLFCELLFLYTFARDIVSDVNTKEYSTHISCDLSTSTILWAHQTQCVRFVLLGWQWIVVRSIQFTLDSSTNVGDFIVSKELNNTASIHPMYNKIVVGLWCACDQSAGYSSVRTAVAFEHKGCGFAVNWGTAFHVICEHLTVYRIARWLCWTARVLG